MADLRRRKVTFVYEPTRLRYWKLHHYKPDLTVSGRSTFYVELKGYFTSADRAKLLAVREAHPMIDLRLLFQDDTKRLNKKSQTTYGDWATQHGFTWWTGDEIPQEWL